MALALQNLRRHGCSRKFATVPSIDSKSYLRKTRSVVSAQVVNALVVHPTRPSVPVSRE